MGKTLYVFSFQFDLFMSKEHAYNKVKTCMEYSCLEVALRFCEVKVSYSLLTSLLLYCNKYDMLNVYIYIYVEDKLMLLLCAICV